MLGYIYTWKLLTLLRVDPRSETGHDVIGFRAHETHTQQGQGNLVCLSEYGLSVCLSALFYMTRMYPVLFNAI